MYWIYKRFTRFDNKFGFSFLRVFVKFLTNSLLTTLRYHLTLLHFQSCHFFAKASFYALILVTHFTLVLSFGLATFIYTYDLYQSCHSFSSGSLIFTCSLDFKYLISYQVFQEDFGDLLQVTHFS